MPDVAEIGAAIVSLKAAFELAKTLVGARDEAVIRQKVIELQGEILSAQASAVTAQSHQATLLQEVGDLKKEVADLRAWGAEKEKYKLVNLSERGFDDGGAFAYGLKDQASSAEPEHYLCANCFNDDRKSILQEEVRFPGRVTILSCHRCGGEINKTGVSYGDTPRGTSKPPRRR
jgi:hypothetical protein